MNTTATNPITPNPIMPPPAPLPMPVVPPPLAPSSQPPISTSSPVVENPTSFVSSPGGPNKKTIIIIIIVAVIILSAVLAYFIFTSQRKITPPKEAVTATCPIQENSGQTIVNFEKTPIQSDLTKENANIGPITTSLSAGTYKVTLVSFEQNHLSTANELSESWFLEIIDQEGNIITQTESIPDLASDKDLAAVTLESEITLTTPASAVNAVHASFPDTTNPNKITPLCAAFELVEKQTSAQCLEIKSYDNKWNLLTPNDLTNLIPGETIRFTVTGNSSTGIFDKARFTINGKLQPETITTKPETNEYYLEYEIPANTKTFVINAEVHHKELNSWF